METQGDSAEGLSRVIYESALNDEIYEVIQDWIFRHSWFSAREGSYLADIFFRRVKNKIEVSWNMEICTSNTGIFKGAYFLWWCTADLCNTNR